MTDEARGFFLRLISCFPALERDALFERCRADPAWIELLVEASQVELLMAVIDS